MPDSINWALLRSEADLAAANAHAPYSGLTVGAAGAVTRGDEMRIVSGCNVESASFGCTLCAECGLVSSFRRSGGGHLLAVSVTDGSGQLLTPCGRCRQLLMETGGPDLLIDHEPEPIRIAELLPHDFGAEDLPQPG